jgi:hypothetical protein
MFGDDGASEEEGGLALGDICAFHSIPLLGKTGFIF